MSDKLNKILVVVFLTVLIWAWAYMSQQQDDNFIGTLKAADSTDPSLLVTFSPPSSPPGSRRQTKIPLTSITLKGPPSNLLDLQRRYRLTLDHPDKERMDFYYDPAEQGREEGTYTLDLLKYLQDNSKMQDLGLTLDSCEPLKVDVHIEQLEERDLPVKCYDKNGGLLKWAMPTPASVSMYVREGSSDEWATVTLTKQEIDLARKQPVSAKPHVNLGVAGVIRESEDTVEITIQSESTQRSFQTPKPIGIMMSQKLQNEYKVTILNEEELPKTVYIFATDDAYQAYRKVNFPRYIVIEDSDVVDLSQIPLKDILYNFPQEYFQRGDIELDESRIAIPVEIKVEPLNSE